MQAASLCVALRVHLDGVETIDIADSVVDGGVKGDGVGAAVGHGDKLIARDVSDSRAEASEEICWSAIFESALETGKVGVGARLGWQ